MAIAGGTEAGILILMSAFSILQNISVDKTETIIPINIPSAPNFDNGIIPPLSPHVIGTNIMKLEIAIAPAYKDDFP